MQMYSLLIAEDEILERRMLEKIIRKEYPMIDRLQLAEHGFAAFEMAKAQPPDILLVDINMPGMTGLELIQALRQEAYGGEIIILTAYDSFAYAQQAIDHEVMGYLLKPVDAGELRGHLAKCFQRIDERTAQSLMATDTQQKIGRLITYIRPQLMRDMLSGVVPEQTLRTLCGWPEEAILQCAVLQIRFADEQPEDAHREALERVLSAFGKYFSFVSLWEAGALFIVMQPLAQMAGEQMYAALFLLAKRAARALLSTAGHLVYISRINASYEALRDTLASRDAFLPWAENTPAALLPLEAVLTVKEQGVRKKKALHRLAEGDAVRVLSLYSRPIADPAQCWCGVWLFADTYSTYTDANALIDLVCGLKPATALRDVRAFLDEALGAVNEKDREDHTMARALALMREQYASIHFSQAWLAEELGLSPAYFSRLYRKKMGESFIVALTNIRMQKAEALLREGTSVAAAATRCGYQSAKYFADAFRQHFGVSAHQYPQEESRP